jgi:hypothetical protein
MYEDTKVTDFTEYDPKRIESMVEDWEDSCEGFSYTPGIGITFHTYEAGTSGINYIPTKKALECYESGLDFDDAAEKWSRSYYFDGGGLEDKSIIDAANFLAERMRFSETDPGLNRCVRICSDEDCEDTTCEPLDLEDKIAQALSIKEEGEYNSGHGFYCLTQFERQSCYNEIYDYIEKNHKNGPYAFWLHFEEEEEEEYLARSTPEYQSVELAISQGF